MREVHFEQGPIRPPSEAYSLLLVIYIRSMKTRDLSLDYLEITNKNLTFKISIGYDVHHFE